MNSTLKKAIGPGLIMAGAAIGVSHLVQSTRAGADYGTSMILFILLACLFKYPFLEFGPRYAAATGESMLVGFRRMGMWTIYVFGLITISTMFVILASITLVTAGLAGVVFGLAVDSTWLSIGVLLLALVVLSLGQYRGLDTLMKFIIGFLMLSTILATALALSQLDHWTTLNPTHHWETIWTSAGIAFLLALLGWMPIPLDVAVWHSLWTLERANQTKHTPSVTESVFDFRLGYLTATISAVIFVLLGASVMSGAGLSFPNGAVAFSSTLIGLYTQNLGQWSHLLIGLAALSAMFSTTLAVMDAYPRVMHGLWSMLSTDAIYHEKSQRAMMTTTHYIWVLIVISAGALLIISFVGQQFTRLIDFATTVSFLSAPILAWMSLRLITSPWVATQHQPSKKLQVLSWAGFIFLLGFCLVWVVWRWH